MVLHTSLSSSGLNPKAESGQHRSLDQQVARQSICAVESRSDEIMKELEK